ncbi:hypothetical protein [Amycolatopsis sp. CA-230715]|uniref:hypothetical protein n=1 Tax=Amycolatopsis sp. CA-230715 TaxID=2745196 RepID=UPI001C009DDA|nr:hypothetical protein [Amycolatopsis sp. CA-230715]QWF82106.1 hypothetical protein HUW46_05543 [Amycolatopsis sp. CA-230715]
MSGPLPPFSPQGPGPQGFQPHQGYPPQPGYPPQQGPQGYPQAGQPEPSAGAARAAASIALVAGIWQVMQVIDQVHQIFGRYPADHIASAAVRVVLALLILPGAILLFTRRPIGWKLIVAGCVAAVLANIASFVLMGFVGVYFPMDDFLKAPRAWSLLVSTVLTIVLLVFALLPSTRRWAASRPLPPVGNPGPWSYAGPHG